jgi:hypothetical protein
MVPVAEFIDPVREIKPAILRCNSRVHAPSCAKCCWISDTILIVLIGRHFVFAASEHAQPSCANCCWIYDAILNYLFRRHFVLQLVSMRSLLAGSEAGCDCVVDNYRPVCPRGKRQLKKAVP